MASSISPLHALDPDRADWTVKVQIVRLWLIKSQLIPDNIISMNFILLDYEGSKILGSIVVEDIDRYFGLLEEGRAYLLSRFHVLPEFNCHSSFPVSNWSQ
ncbi:hypothetical protein P8452_18802 [Trifolium repens]|nr:replication protein A 1A [Trifolium repens]WJX30239.1 hypothetical protein P8452_18802 [Trifolium repens]